MQHANYEKHFKITHILKYTGTLKKNSVIIFLLICKNLTKEKKGFFLQLAFLQFLQYILEKYVKVRQVPNLQAVKRKIDDGQLYTS